MQIQQPSPAPTATPTAFLLDLPARKRVFVQQYLVDLKAREAAIRTGYAPNSAHVTASRLLAEPKVRRIKTRDGAIVEVEFADTLKALSLLARVMGLIDKPTTRRR